MEITRLGSRHKTESLAELLGFVVKLHAQVALVEEALARDAEVLAGGGHGLAPGQELGSGSLLGAGRGPLGDNPPELAHLQVALGQAAARPLARAVPDLDLLPDLGLLGHALGLAGLAGLSGGHPALGL